MKGAPLADRMRPVNFEEFVGQEHLVGPGKLLRNLVEADELSSLIFWGPPGVGKTTLAKIIAEETNSHFEMLSAVMSGKEELRRIIAEAEKRRDGKGQSMNRQLIPDKSAKAESRKTILFIDEIHRWNKAQQDALLSHVENGTLTLIGATTENPSFEIIGALLSRSRVFVLKFLSPANILAVVERALKDKERGLGNLSIQISKETLELLSELSGGDARNALNTLELAVKAKAKDKKIILTSVDIKEATERTTLVFDKKGEEFYNVISALHKSMRGSDPNASLYWLARMLEGGVDPLYVARRVLRFASEDIGLANSEALLQANAAFDACHKLGMPECSVHLAQAVVFCAKSAKSNLLYLAYGKAAKDAHDTSHLGVPLHLRNAPTKLMKDIGYGKDYKYNPAYDEPVDQDYLPKELKGRDYLGESPKS